jgi:hypothetical protein
VDVVEVTPGGEIIGYEVKLPHIGREESARALQGTYIVQGIGQALEYLIGGFDRAYLVTLEGGINMGYLSKLMERTIPFLGLITVDRGLRVRVVREAERTHLYDQEDREGAEWLYSLKGRGKGPMPSSLRRYLAGEVDTKIGV